MAAAPDEKQEALLRQTGNGPTVENEEELLRALFGEPDAHGIYRGPADGDA